MKAPFSLLVLMWALWGFAFPIQSISQFGDAPTALSEGSDSPPPQRLSKADGTGQGRRPTFREYMNLVQAGLLSLTSEKSDSSHTDSSLASIEPDATSSAGHRYGYILGKQPSHDHDNEDTANRHPQHDSLR
ncbi:uncharacterized protein N7459_006588 [Penicillium hispanicum]|uniref:uncharacterized protein n=1 Tax=Penicillium hispanicum TaxID=1080232 RepID=UPI002540A74D|nr:uncharacterized protein N7459_006588 [Penicillium hispanicum]KAJ5577624.1 hypothetical protein N7459_006588 [Penicillium hispanicum]